MASTYADIRQRYVRHTSYMIQIRTRQCMLFYMQRPNYFLDMFKIVQRMRGDSIVCYPYARHILEMRDKLCLICEALKVHYMNSVNTLCIHLWRTVVDCCGQHTRHMHNVPLRNILKHSKVVRMRSFSDIFSLKTYVLAYAIV